MALKVEDRKFGEYLVRCGILSEEQLLDALKYKKFNDAELSAIIVERDLADAHDVYARLADYLNLPFVELRSYEFDSSVIELIPTEIASEHCVFPLFKIGNTLTVAMANPGDVQVIDALHRETSLEIEPAVSLESEIEEAIARHYQTDFEINESYDEVIEHIEREKPEEEQQTAERLKELSAETPVVKLVNLIISQAIKEGASDIHIEPEEKSLEVRYRIDGVMHEGLSPPKQLQSAIISRIKILSDLDIAETRAPQDGRFHISINNKSVDFRVSTLTTVYGENVVMRILDNSSLTLDLEQLGMESDVFTLFKEMLSSSYGVLLVSGPTGSGKTTTLYSALSSLNTPDQNIVTIEDPVEYRLKRIRQAQVNVKAGLTFAAGLRSILRQDPDIIMVGEIRDTETAKIAVQSALTGHLVLSTIHTNDAPGGLTRLNEMGIEPFLIASATVGILAQRLVRRICRHCKTTYEPPESVLKQLNLQQDGAQDWTFYHGAGCSECKETGYKGRQGIYELMAVNEEIRPLVLEDASTDQLKRAAIQNGMNTLRRDALIKAKNGMTTLDEVFRVTNPDETTKH